MHRRSEIINVVVPIYEMKGELRRLENWISGIKSSKFRIYLIDDTTDTTASDEILSLVRRNSHLKITLLSNRYGSPGAARNAGLNEITEGWVAFWDADDSPLPGKIEIATNEVGPDISIVIGNYITQDYDSNLENPVDTNSNPPNWLNITANPGIWRFIFRRELIGQLKFPNYRLGEDQIFLAQVLSKNPKVLFSKLCFYVYTTGRKNSLTNSREYNRVTELRLAKKSMRKLISKNSKFRVLVLSLYLKILVTLAREKVRSHGS